ncbi:MAG: hypothetical protein ABSE73_12140 [Planctomycetota bacterium]
MASIWSSRDLSGTRDAVLVNGLATLAGCISIVLAIILRPEDQAFGPGLGVALSATGVLLVWSLTLAVRAWRRGEHSGWCWAVMALGGPEAVLLGVVAYLIRFVLPFSSLGDWAYETGLIVFLPVGAIAYLVAVPMTWWRLRGAARRDAESSAGLRAGGDAGATTRSHWKRGLIWFCAVAGLLTALLLPFPLFLYCVSWSSMHWRVHNWKTWVMENTPIFVAEPAAGALTLSSHKAAVDLYYHALMSGRVSRKRLLSEVNSTDYIIQECAFTGLELADPQAALSVADQIGQGSIFAWMTDLLQRAGNMIGRRGTREQIRYFLDQDTTESPPDAAFMKGLLDALDIRRAFLPELTSSCKKTSTSREHGLMILAERLPPKDLPGVWAEFLADSDPLRRQQAIKCIPYISDMNARLAVLVACFESPDPSVRQEIQQLWLVYHSYAVHGCESGDTVLVKRLVNALLPALDEADRATRCAAACSLYALVGAHWKLRRDWYFFSDVLRCQAKGESVAWATEKEQDKLESIRAAARKWLDDHK